MKKLICISLILSALISIQGCQDRKGKNYNKKSLVDDNGLSFIKEASESDLIEIEASGLVKGRSTNPQIIHFAEILVDHHIKMGEELQKLSSENLVSNIDTLSLDHQKDIAELSNKKGAEFDQAYITMMLKDHQKAVKLFGKAMKNKKPSIKSFAEKNLHILLAHLDSARNISSSLK